MASPSDGGMASSSQCQRMGASTASAPRVDPAAATFAIGRAAAEGQNAKQQLKILCDKFSASLTVAAVTDAVPRGSYAFECVVDGSRCGVGTARSKKDAKERAAALAHPLPPRAGLTMYRLCPAT